MPTSRAEARHRANAIPTLGEIAQLVGGEDTAAHTAILATGATFVEIEQALLAAGGIDEPLGQTSHPLEGRAAAVYEILTTNADEDR
jgi:hypothetical protein